LLSVRPIGCLNY